MAAKKKIVRKKRAGTSSRTSTAQHKHRQELMTMASDLISRAELAGRLGKQFDGDRDLYQVLGYKTQPTLNDYDAKYLRTDVARRIIDEPAKATWRRPPRVINDQDPDKKSKFERSWEELSRRLKATHYMERLDRLAGIGHYGVLLIGTADAKNEQAMMRPIASKLSAEQILYLSPFKEKNADIFKLDDNPSSVRFGMPEIYRLRISDGKEKSSSLNVHHSRVIHVAENLGEDDIYGTPRLEPVLNRLEDLEKIAGGSAEIFWQAAKRILVMQAKDDFTAVNDDQALTDALEELVHGLRRVIDVQGYEVNTLPPTDVKPEEAFNVTISLISSATGIPRRILLGSEQGKLASEQDEDNWNAQITTRQQNFAEPIILRPFIDKLISVGALPDPGEYFVEWPSLYELSDKEKGAVGLLKARAVRQFVGTEGRASEVMTVEEFREVILGLPGIIPDSQVDASDILPPAPDTATGGGAVSGGSSSF